MIYEDKIKDVLEIIISKHKLKPEDLTYYYDVDYNRYVILHNFIDNLFNDDSFGTSVSNILYNGLDILGITNYDFYEDNCKSK